MTGTVLSPKALWLWLEYFWWNGEGIVICSVVEPDICLETDGFSVGYGGSLSMDKEDSKERRSSGR